MYRRDRTRPGVRQHDRRTLRLPAAQQNIGPAYISYDGQLGLDCLEEGNVVVREVFATLIDKI
jgi:hypothetical protein